MSALAVPFGINLEPFFTVSGAYIYASYLNMALSPDAAEIIRRKKTEYCRFADTNQFHLFDRIALPDATFRFAGPDGNILNENGIVYSWENRQTFCDAFTEALANVQCVSVLGSGCLSFHAVSMAPCL